VWAAFELTPPKIQFNGICGGQGSSTLLDLKPGDEFEIQWVEQSG